MRRNKCRKAIILLEWVLRRRNKCAKAIILLGYHATVQIVKPMLNAVLWVARTGAPWRDLPSHYGPWSSAYSFFWRFQKANLWQEILKHVAIKPEWEQVMVDVTTVRVHQHGAGAKGGKTSRRIHAGDSEQAQSKSEAFDRYPHV